MGDAMWPAASEMGQWLAVDETAKTMLSRMSERCAPSITPRPPLHRAMLHGRNVLEIAGPSGSGKSELLLQSAVTCILPKEWDGLSLCGSEKPVLYLDLDCRFDIRRLVHLLECRIHDAQLRLDDAAWEMREGGGRQILRTSSVKQRQRDQEFRGITTHKSEETSDPKGTVRSTEMLIKSCLQRFYLKRCRNSFEFLVALKTVRADLYRVAAQHCTNAELLIVDSIGAFYWLERTTRSASVETGRKTLNLWTVSEAVVNELRQVLHLHPKLLIMVTKTMIFKRSENENLSSWKGGHSGRSNAKSHRPGYRKIPQELFTSDEFSSKNTTEKNAAEESASNDFLPASWRGFVTHRVILQGPYQSVSGLPSAADLSQQLEVPNVQNTELAPIDRFTRISPSFFTAEWDKPMSGNLDFFVIQDDGIQLAN